MSARRRLRDRRLHRHALREGLAQPLGGRLADLAMPVTGLTAPPHAVVFQHALLFGGGIAGNLDDDVNGASIGRRSRPTRSIPRLARGRMRRFGALGRFLCRRRARRSYRRLRRAHFLQAGQGVHNLTRRQVEKSGIARQTDNQRFFRRGDVALPLLLVCLNIGTRCALFWIARLLDSIRDTCCSIVVIVTS